MFRLHTVAQEIKSVRVYEQRHKETPTSDPTKLSECQLLTNEQLLQNSLIFIYLNSDH